MFRSILLKAIPRATPATRTYATAAGENGFIEERRHIAEHAAKSSALWRKVTFYVACPAIIVGYLNAASMMKEHEAHVEHIKEENGGELPERVVYPYFNKRDKDFPWGPNTVFYNPHVNIAPPSE